MIRYNGEFCHFLSVLSNRKAFAIAITLLEQGPLTQKALVAELKEGRGIVRDRLQRLIRCGYVAIKPARPSQYAINKRILLPLLRMVGTHLRRQRGRPKS